MAITRTQKFLATGAAAIGLAVGAAGVGLASTGTEVDDPPDGPSAYTSSVTAPEGTSLASLVKITPAQAAAAARAAAGGTTGKVELENENGNVVYGVAVTRHDGSKLDVKVDAGTGAVLAQEADDDAEVSD
jgi:uncharacterized membrane protein YkoI